MQTLFAIMQMMGYVVILLGIFFIVSYFFPNGFEVTNKGTNKNNYYSDD